jgi:carbon monoxide dehydrogenase subunit G
VLITSDIEVAQPPDAVWRFFADIPQVAACLPGAELTEDLGDDRYRGRVTIRMGPVKLQFAGIAEVQERDDEARRIVVDAAGADEKGRGRAAMNLTATVASAPGGSRVDVAQDIEVAGAAAQYGRGMVSDVTAVLLRDFSANVAERIAAAERGEALGTASASPASGLSVGLAALRLALARVLRRFFLPYRPEPA